MSASHPIIAHIADAYSTTCERIPGGKARFVILGETTSGRAVTIKIDIPFRRWLCASSEFRHAWKIEREDRIREINRIDEETRVTQ